MGNLFKDLIYSRTDKAMAARTALEAILGWLMANLPEILNLFTIPDAAKPLLSSFVMVIISWALGELRKRNDEAST